MLQVATTVRLGMGAGGVGGAGAGSGYALEIAAGSRQNLIPMA